MSPEAMAERGNASIVVIGGTTLLLVFVLGLADLAAFALARARAQTAADAAALAAVAEMVPGSSSDPRAQAERLARANGARLVSCDCSRGSGRATVMVAISVDYTALGPLGPGEVRARSRAGIDFRRMR